MKIRMQVVMVSVVALLLTACQGSESTVTGGFGNDTVTGHVVFVDEYSEKTPEGVEVRIVGTGLSTRTDGEGRFALVGVPSEAITVAFERHDGVSGRINLAASDRANVRIDINARGTSRSRRRGVGHPGVEIEGAIKSITGDTIVVTDARSKLELDVKVVAETIIRKGNQTLTIADLGEGDRLHVKAKFVDNVRTAVEIKLQNKAGEDDDDGDDDSATITANGIVQEVGSDQIVVVTADGRVITVKVDADTRIKRRGRTFPLADIKVGDRAECLGTRIDDTTMLAKKIETQERG